MPLGPFKPPQAGPKIGKVMDISELPKSRQAEIGDFAAELRAATAQTETSGSVVAAAPVPVPVPVSETVVPSPSIEPPEPSPETMERVEKGIEAFETLKQVLDREDDPIDVEATPTADDKAEYLRCILGNRHYQKRFELFGGSIVMDLRDLSPSEEDHLFAELARRQLVSNDDWALWLDRLRLLVNMEHLSIIGQPEYKHGLDEPVLEQLPDFLARFKSATVYRAAIRAVRVFRRHLDIMLEKAGDAGFWAVDGSNLQSEPTQAAPSTTVTNL